MPKTHLESEFQAFLGQLRADPEQVGNFPKIAARIWQAKRGSSEQMSKKLTSQLEEQKKLKANLLTMRMNGEVTREEFEEANAAFRDKILDIEEKVRTFASTRVTAESFVHFAELQLTDMAHVWRIASPEQRERVQNLLFQDGLDYSPKSSFLNRSKSSLFNALKTIDLQKETLVEAAGVEPASEIAVSQENPCSVQFRRFHFGRSERTKYARS
jgi:hypothetical protein